MDEQIVAKAERIRKAGDEARMLLRDRTADLGQCGPLAPAVELRRIASVAFEALATAIFEPAGQDSALALQKAKEHFLMIAGQEIGLDRVMTVGPHPLDHAVRVRPAVDQIAEHHQQIAARRPTLDILFDLPEQLIEQVEPPVDVAHRIGPIAFRSPRRTVLPVAPT